MEDLDDKERLYRLFMPYANKRMRGARDKDTRFVHYTSADAAMSIIQNREIWMRNSTCMNDYKEVVHGLDCLIKCYRGEIGQRLKNALEDVFEGICADFESRFDSWIPHFETNTYIMCVSEHEDSEDRFGRLSMWRAYGETTGVALIFNNKAFLSRSNALKAYTSPVAYLNEEEFSEEVSKVSQGIEENVEFLRGQGHDAILSHVFYTMMFATLCTKHPGFKEEREWRVTHSPSLEHSDRLIKEIRLIGGTPQTIYKIPLKNVPEEGFTGAEIPELIERIIIGPTQYPVALSTAFFDLLESAGVKDAANRIVVSDIPIR